MTRRLTWHDDSLREMAGWAIRKYGLGQVHIIWRSFIYHPKRVKSSKGCVTTLDEKSLFCIELLEGETHSKLLQVLAHELTHCVAIKRHGYHGHGLVFRRISTELIGEWNTAQSRARRKRDPFDDLVARAIREKGQP